MAAELSEEDLDEVLDAHVGSTWRNSKAVFTQERSGRIDLFANPVLRKATGVTLLASTSMETISDWINTLSASLSLEVILVPQQNLYGALTAMASEQEWKTRVRRIARRGDCQAGGNFGTENEEAYAKETLEAEGLAGGRSVVIERVIGTELLLMQANFIYSEEVFLAGPLKSCRPIDEIEKFLQQLYYGKELKVALSTDPELSRWFRSRGGVLERIWKNVRPSDSLAARERSSVAANHTRYAARSPTQDKPAMSWLDAARKAAGLRFGSDSAANQGPNRLRHSHVAAFMAAKRAASLQEHEAVLRSLADCADPAPAGLEIVNTARAIALSALGRRPPGALFDMVLKEDAKNQLWWAEAVTALMRHVVATKEPAGWLESVIPLAPGLVQAVAMESDDMYKAARQALEKCSLVAMLDLLPFETFELALELNGLYKKIKELLSPANRFAAFSDSDDLSELSYYLTFESMRSRCSKQLQHHLLQRGCAKWGRTKRYFMNATFADWLEVPVEQTLEMCGEWRSQHPEDECAWCFTGRVLATDGRSAEALEFLDHALQLKPNDPETVRRKAGCVWALERDDEAIELLEGLRKREQKDPAVEVLLARIHSVAERDSLACELFTPLDDADIVAYSGLFSFLVSLARTRDWRDHDGRFFGVITKLNETEHARVLGEAANRIIDLELFADAELLVPHIQWNDEVWRCLEPICDALAMAGSADKAVGLFETARTKSLGGEDLYYYYSQFCCYGPIPDPKRALAVCREGIGRFPEDGWLRVAAGIAANACGEDPSPFWTMHLDKLGASPTTQRTTEEAILLAYGLWFSGLNREAAQALKSYISMKKEVGANIHLFDALVTLSIGESANAPYSKAATALKSLPVSRRREHLRCHLLDLEAYAMRGIVSDLLGAVAVAKTFIHLQ